MHTMDLKRLCLVPLVIAIMMLTSCDANPKEWKTPNMTVLTPRLQLVFEKTKTVCFGRFLVDVPVSATVAWGDADVPLRIRVYPDGVDTVKASSKKFIDELKSEKAIYHNNASLLISINDLADPEGQIVTGYDGFEALTDLKINGYFKLSNAGVVINARPLQNRKDYVIAEISNMARRLRQQVENEIPAEPGNCIEYAFLPDNPGINNEPHAELLNIGFRLKEFPDAHFSISVAPSNSHDPEGDSLERQWNRIIDEATPKERKTLASTKFFRKSARRIRDWDTGYEVLMRSPDEDGSRAHHDFQIKFTGVPHDPFKPYADIQFQTGVADNAAGATKASLTDDEAIAVWDKITSTIRVRPTTAAPVKSADADPRPRLPLGELAATGRTCPQTGWWEPSEAKNIEGARRHHFQAGELMPHAMVTGEPSMWQKLKGERPVYRTATVWKLVDYGAAPARADATAQASPAAARKDEARSPHKEG